MNQYRPPIGRVKSLGMQIRKPRYPIFFLRSTIENLVTEWRPYGKPKSNRRY